MRTLYCAVSVALLLLVVSGNASTQSQQPNPKADNAKNGAMADQRGTAKSPLVIEIIPSNNAKKDVADNTAERQEKLQLDRDLVRFTEGLRNLTGVLAAIGVLQLIVFSLQARRLRQSVDEMKVAGKNTKMAANAAKESAVATVKTAMPILFPWITDMAGLHPLTTSDSEISHEAKIFVGFDNFGKTPGMIREVRAELFLKEMETLPKVDFDNLTIRNYHVMIPGESRATNQIFGALDMQQTIKFTPLELRELFSEARGKFRRFSLIGQVIYDDFFGLRHTGRFCVKIRMWRVNETLSGVRCFQVAQGGSEYNRITSKQIPEDDPLAKA